MGYLTQNDIANNASMLARVAQAAAEEDYDDVDRWTYYNRRTWAAAPGWDDAWDSFKASHPNPDPIPVGYIPPDPGADEGVITDAMILSQVQTMPNVPPLP